MKRNLVVGLTLLVLASCGEDYVQQIQQWQAERAERLQSEDGWLTLVGLHWLEARENRFGTAAGNDVVFPEGTAPALAGSFFLEGDQVRVKAAPDVELQRQLPEERASEAEAEAASSTERVRERVLVPDSGGQPDILLLGDLRFYVIERAGRYGIRVKNPNSPTRVGFEGLDYFPIDVRYRVEAAYVPYDEPKQVSVPTIIGTENKMLAPGYVEFEIDGQTVTMDPLVSDLSSESFWFIFKDATSGKETYGAGRYLYSERERDGKVTIDFNRAYNMPCAFTPYATCPLPPRQNRLEVRIEAGEKAYSGHH